MLKTTSSTINAIGALNYKGTWDANANSPTLTSSVGTKGDYYVVSVAGTTNLNGETLWGVGDMAVFNGAIWQKVDGGDTGIFTDVTTGNITITNSISANLTSSATATFGTSSLPLVPLGYVSVTINGTLRKIPYYAV
ncbi:UNVERIFIED_CONTAM: hypothetical protein [Bacteriophage sp.]|jgi:hypothetical protein